MWRLFASIVAITDNGSIAMSNDQTDWPTERSCMAAIEQIYVAPRGSQTIGGHPVTFRIKAACLRVEP
jgi:hypothetical protein